MNLVDKEHIGALESYFIYNIDYHQQIKATSSKVNLMASMYPLNLFHDLCTKPIDLSHAFK